MAEAGQQTPTNHRLVVPSHGRGMIREGGVPVPGPGRPKKEVTDAKRKQAEAFEQAVLREARNLAEAAMEAFKQGNPAPYKELAKHAGWDQATQVDVTVRHEVQADLILAAARAIEAQAIEAEFEEVD